jgi:hypothetical protein
MANDVELMKLSELSRRHINRMLMHDSVTTPGGMVLPSIHEVEQTLGIPRLVRSDGDDVKTLYDSRKRLLRMRRYSDLYVHIQCPVCMHLCTSKTLVTCCVIAEHYMCIHCVVQMLIHSTNRLAKHRCPTCKRMLYIKRPSVMVLSLVDAMISASDVVTCDSVDVVSVYESFVYTDILTKYAPYSYGHLVVFARMINKLGGIETMVERLKAVNAYNTFKKDMDDIMSDYSSLLD